MYKWSLLDLLRNNSRIVVNWCTEQIRVPASLWLGASLHPCPRTTLPSRATAPGGPISPAVGHTRPHRASPQCHAAPCSQETLLGLPGGGGCQAETPHPAHGALSVSEHLLGAHPPPLSRGVGRKQPERRDLLSGPQREAPGWTGCRPGPGQGVPPGTARGWRGPGSRELLLPLGRVPRVTRCGSALRAGTHARPRVHARTQAHTHTAEEN